MRILCLAGALFFFCTLSASWELPAQRIGNASSESTSVDLLGNWAVWSVQSGTGSVIMVSQYDEEGKVWLDPVRVSHPDVYADHPKVAYSKNGSAIIVWEAGSPNHSVIQGVIRTESSNPWLGPWTLSGSCAKDPAVHMDDSGNALILWCEEGNIKSLQFKQGVWHRAVKISNDNDASGLKFVVSGDNLAIALWERGEGENHTLETSFFDPCLDTWSPPVGLIAFEASQSGVNINRSKTVFVSWLATLPYSSFYCPSLYCPSLGSWSHPIPCLNLPLKEKVTTLADTNDALMVGVVSLNQSDYLVAAHYDAKLQSWSPHKVLCGPEAQISHLSAKADAAGNTFVVFSYGEAESTNLVQSLSYEASTKTWSFLEPLSSTLPSVSPKVTFDNEGAFFAGWISEESLFITQNRADFTPLAPLNPTGSRRVSLFQPFPFDVIHTLKWEAPLDPSIRSYRIRYRGELIDEVTTPLLVLPNRRCYHNYTYEVTSVSLLGKESEPVKIFIRGYQ